MQPCTAVTAPTALGRYRLFTSVEKKVGLLKSKSVGVGESTRTLRGIRRVDAAMEQCYHEAH